MPTRNYSIEAVLFFLAVVGCSTAPVNNEWNRFHGRSRHAAALALAEVRGFTVDTRCFDLPDQLACRVFEAEEVESESVTVAVRELHSEECGGDPHSAPVLARLKVSRQDGMIRCWHAGEDVYTECSSNCGPTGGPDP